MNVIPTDAITAVAPAITSPDWVSNLEMQCNMTDLDLTTEDSATENSTTEDSTTDGATLDPEYGQDMANVSTQHSDTIRRTGRDAAGATMNATINTPTGSLNTNTAVVPNSLQDLGLPCPPALADKNDNPTGEEEERENASPATPGYTFADSAGFARSTGRGLDPHGAISSVLTGATSASSNADAASMELPQQITALKQRGVANQMPTMPNPSGEETFLAYNHAKHIFSSMEAALARHRVEQSLPTPMELAVSTAHLLAASHCTSHEEFNITVAELLLANGEAILRLYKQALLCRFIHHHDLCVVPDAWLQAHEGDPDAFLSKYNFFEDVDGIRHRFDLASNLFPKISRLRKGKGTGQRKTCKEKRKARGQTVLIIVTQMLRVIAPSLFLDIDAALILAGYDNMAGNSQFSRKPVAKQKLLKTSTGPVPMAVLYMRTKMAAANNFARKENRLGKRNSAVHINKITREDATVWRTTPTQDTHGQQAGKGISAAGPFLSKLERTNKRKELASAAQHNNASPQPHHKKRKCANLPEATTGANTAAVTPDEHCTGREPAPQPAGTGARPGLYDHVTVTESDGTNQCPISRRRHALAMATDRNRDELAVMWTLASLGHSVAGPGTATTITPVMQEDLPDASAGNNPTTLNGPVRMPVTRDNPNADPVASDGCLDTNSASQPSNGPSTALRKVPSKSKAAPARRTATDGVHHKRKPPIRRKFRTEQDMPEVAMVPRLSGPNDFYICYDRMHVAFRKHATDIHYWSHDDLDLIQALEPTEIIAISGHVLGYSAVWNAHDFNAWVYLLCSYLTQDQANSANDGAGTPDSITMYKDARLCRFVIEADLLRLPQSTLSLLGTTEQHMNSSCPSSQQSTALGVESIPVGSRARFRASFAGSMHSFDSAQWIFSSIVDPTLPGDTLSSKLLSFRMAERRKMLRAETLGIVINTVLLRYQHPKKFHMDRHAVMQIAGYPSLDGHKLPDRYVDTVSPRRAELPPVNMETLFARASIAMAKCESRQHPSRIAKIGEARLITRNDATAWRDDPHLRTNKIPCLFQRKPSTGQSSISPPGEMAHPECGNR